LPTLRAASITILHTCTAAATAAEQSSRNINSNCLHPHCTACVVHPSPALLERAGFAPPSPKISAGAPSPALKVVTPPPTLMSVQLSTCVTLYTQLPHFRWLHALCLSTITAGAARHNPLAALCAQHAIPSSQQRQTGTPPNVCPPVTCHTLCAQLSPPPLACCC
jgi:hypothetical protein